MSSLVLETNVKVPDIEVFVLLFSKYAASNLQTDEKYVSISYRYNEYLTFAGKVKDPAFLLVITTMGELVPPRNAEYSKKLFGFLKTQLNTPGDRGYITFYNPGAVNFGYDGKIWAQVKL